MSLLVCVNSVPAKCYARKTSFSVTHVVDYKKLSGGTLIARFNLIFNNSLLSISIVN